MTGTRERTGFNCVSFMLSDVLPDSGLQRTTAVVAGGCLETALKCPCPTRKIQPHLMEREIKFNRSDLSR